MQFIPTLAGLDVQIGPMFVGQGHTDQFVAEMLQAGLSPNYEFRVNGRRYTLLDFNGLSTDFFRGPGNRADMQQRISSTGHIFEWLAQSLPAEQLRANWVREGANALSLMILDVQSAPVEGGTLYHAIHGRHLYRAGCCD